MYRFRFNEVFRYTDLIIDGLLRALWLTGLSAALGLMLGTAAAAVLVYGHRRFHPVIYGYVEAFRNTPFLVQLFFIFFGLASLGFRLSAVTAAILALTLNFGAYTTEVARAGLQSVPKAQIESALSLGLKPWDIFRDVVALQAFRNVFPSITSYIILLFLGTSIVSQISVDELMRSAATIESTTYRSFEAYSIVCLVYLAVVILFRLLMSVVWNVLLKRRG